jgi:hypothetical protein
VTGLNAALSGVDAMAMTVEHDPDELILIINSLTTLLTLMLVTALNLGTTNFRAMTNMQFRSEAIASANKALEQVISSPFTAAPTAETINVDLNNDATNDYIVQINVPQCIYASQAFGADPSSMSLPPSMSAASTWNTVWDLMLTWTRHNAGGAAARQAPACECCCPK